MSDFRDCTRLVIGVLVVLMLLAAAGLVLVFWGKPPASPVAEDATMSSRWMWWLLSPVLGIGVYVAWNWIDPRPAPMAAAPAVAANPEPAREYVLEVVGLGVTYEKYRQDRLWEVLSTGSPYATLREQDPKKYPWHSFDKSGISGGRANDAMENGAKRALDYWGVPTFRVDVPELGRVVPARGPAGVMGDTGLSGMLTQIFIGTDWELAEYPDRLLERVFAFFDRNPDVPYVALNASEDPTFRDRYRAEGTPPLLRDEYYIPEPPDSSMLVLLARRERVDALRRWAFDDFDESGPGRVDEANERGYARRLWLAYLDLKERLRKADDQRWGSPTVAEWHRETAAFAKRPDIYSRKVSMLDRLSPNSRPSPDYVPTPWLPLPWSTDQLKTFDNLSSFGYLHRPVYVDLLDADGHPLRTDARSAALARGWQQALETLPEAQRAAAPARIAFSDGGLIEQQVALVSMLDTWARNGGPELDRSDPKRWIYTDARMGNTGVATWFMQIAIGLMGSYRDGGASAAINLRNSAAASIVLVTPPTPERLARQNHGKDGDALRTIVGPSIDPGNYR